MNATVTLLAAALALTATAVAAESNGDQASRPPMVSVEIVPHTTQRRRAINTPSDFKTGPLAVNRRQTDMAAATGLPLIVLRRRRA